MSEGEGEEGEEKLSPQSSATIMQKSYGRSSYEAGIMHLYMYYIRSIQPDLLFWFVLISPSPPSPPSSPLAELWLPPSLLPNSDNNQV